MVSLVVRGLFSHQQVCEALRQFDRLADPHNLQVLSAQHTQAQVAEHDLVIHRERHANTSWSSTARPVADAAVMLTKATQVTRAPRASSVPVLDLHMWTQNFHNGNFNE